MARRSHIVVLASVCTTTFSAVFDGSGSGRDALSMDDVCDTEGGCAVSHLQISSRDAGVAVQRQQRATSATEVVDVQDDPWVFNVSTVWANWNNIMGDDSPYKLTDNPWIVELLARITSPIAVGGCPIWMTHMMPMVSFWSQELRRRVKAQPDDVSAENQEKLRYFAKVAGYFICTSSLDPRKGADYHEQVSSYWRKIASAPATSLEVPKLDASLLKHNDDLTSPAGCPIWSVGVICDLGFLTESLTGNKAKPGEICWDKLTVPESYLGTVDATLENQSHPEYSECFENLLQKEQMEEICPMHGKYPVNMWGVQSWGKRPSKDSAVYKDVMQCQRKIGIPRHDFPTAKSMDAVELGLL